MKESIVEERGRESIESVRGYRGKRSGDSVG